MSWNPAGFNSSRGSCFLAMWTRKKVFKLLLSFRVSSSLSEDGNDSPQGSWEKESRCHEKALSVRKEMASFANMHWYFSQEKNQHPRFLLLIVWKVQEKGAEKGSQKSHRGELGTNFTKDVIFLLSWRLAHYCCSETNRSGTLLTHLPLANLLVPRTSLGHVHRSTGALFSGVPGSW